MIFSKLTFLIVGMMAFRCFGDERPPLDGKTLFVNNCSACHGPTGRGDGPAAQAMKDFKPRNFVEDKFKYGETFDEVLATVTKGVPNTPMPSWSSLPENERKALVRYVLSLRKSKLKK